MYKNIEEVLELCRLCQVTPGTIEIVDNDKFINQVFECTKIKINSDRMNILPKTVCASCKLSIEEFFVFMQEIRIVDQKLQDRLFKCEDPKSDLHCNNCSVDLSTSVTVKDNNKISFNKRFKCPICPKTYSRHKNLQCHKKSHPNLYCTGCTTIFDDVTLQRSHVCNSSNESLSNKKSDDIILNNGSSEIITTNNCNNLNKSNESIETSQLNDIEISHNCDQLTEIDENKKVKIEGSSVCDICDETFICNADFRAHQKHQHRSTFSCTFENCNKICSSAYTLRTHLMKHEGKMPFLCVTCGKGFTTKNSLNCHEKTHAKIKGYVCKECNIGFSVASNLRAHQKKHHEGVRFYCSQCTRAFITKCSLERHELVHTGIKEFKCGTCKAAFYTNKELLKHQRYHQGLRLYKCDQCFKTFFEKHHLTIHIRVHTGERPYVCKVSGCGKSFTESQKLSRHMKARHPTII